jgi:hypothetical protein
MKSCAIDKLTLAAAGWVALILLASLGCSAAPNRGDLDKIFSRDWMLKSSEIETRIKRMLMQRCGDRPTTECMTAVGFNECSESEEGARCSYSGSIIVEHSPRANVKHRKDKLVIGVRIFLRTGTRLNDADIIIDRSGTDFIFR